MYSSLVAVTLLTSYSISEVYIKVTTGMYMYWFLTFYYNTQEAKLDAQSNYEEIKRELR